MAAIKSSPAWYWANFASSPITFCIIRLTPLALLRRCCITRWKRWAWGTWPAAARDMVTSPCPSTKLIMPPTASNNSFCRSLANSWASPPSAIGSFPSRFIWTKSWSPCLRRSGSGSTSSSIWFTKSKKRGRNQGTPVNCERCVNSWRANQSLNCFGSNANFFSIANTFGPT